MIFPLALKIKRINNLTSIDFEPIQSINGAGSREKTIGICPVVTLTFSHIAHPWSSFFPSTIVDLSRSTQCCFTKLNRYLIREWLTNPQTIAYRIEARIVVISSTCIVEHQFYSLRILRQGVHQSFFSGSILCLSSHFSSEKIIKKIHRFSNRNLWWMNVTEKRWDIMFIRFCAFFCRDRKECDPIFFCT